MSLKFVIDHSYFVTKAPEVLVPEPPEFKWRTKDGVLIKISDMTERHVRNIIQMINDNRIFSYKPSLGQIWKARLIHELNSRTNKR